MLKNKKRVVVTIGCLLLLLLGMPASAEGIDFSVRAQLPENQYDTEKTYFDLMMKPGQEQTIQLRLENKKETPITILADINTAITNSNGVVEYSRTIEDKDSTLLYTMDEIVSYDKEITIAGKSADFLNIHIKMPEKEYEGVLAGGITLSQKHEETEVVQEEEQTVSIKNEIAYVIGLVLHTTETIPETQLELHEVYAGSINAQNVIRANIQNTVAAFARDLKVTADVFLKGKPDVLYHSEYERMKMAPNSNFDCPIYLEGKRMEPGDYLVEIKAETGGKIWEWQREFNITKEEAQQFNELDLFIEEETAFPFWLFMAALILVIILTVVVTITIYKKNHRRKNL